MEDNFKGLYVLVGEESVALFVALWFYLIKLSLPESDKSRGNIEHCGNFAY
jgi:hypothetical protein